MCSVATRNKDVSGKENCQDLQNMFGLVSTGKTFSRVLEIC